MGLVVFAVIGLYLLLSIGVVKGAMALARNGGRSVKLWGWGAALVMYLIPFWDLLPTLAAEKYYCATESGFFVRKTLEQWKQENPGVMETLSLAHLPEQYRIGNHPLFKNHRMYQLPDGTLLRAFFDVKDQLMFVEYKKPDGESGVQLNERFRRMRKHEGPGLLKLSREEHVLIDIGTNEVLARQVDFRQATEGKIWGVAGDSGWKFWFQSYDSCIKDHPERFPNGGMATYAQHLDTDCPGKRAEEILKDGLVISCPWRP